MFPEILTNNMLVVALFMILVEKVLMGEKRMASTVDDFFLIVGK